jgi:pilus assembly protein CpaF
VTRVNGFNSPLIEIETRVQDRAKELRIDPGTADGAADLARLIEEATLQWNLDYKRGLRDVELADPAGVVTRVRHSLLGYGPIDELLADDDVWEIMANAPDAIFVKRHRGVSGYHDEAFHDDEHVRRILTRILDDASTSHRTLDPKDGLQDAQLVGGARLHIVHGDIARGGHLMFNIRKFSGVSYRSLDELEEVGTLSSPLVRFLRAAVAARLSIVFAGAPGSGKTTLLSCCAAELDPALRVVTAEEVFEADIPLPNVASMQTRPARAERAEVTLRHLVAGFLRMAPDVAIVGEVRDREALPLLLTLSSGVTGYTTIHSGSARQALTRLRFICQLAGTSTDLPMSALNALVAEAVDLVVHLERTPAGIEITSVLAVEDQTGGPESVQFTATELFARPRRGAASQWTGHHPIRAGHKLAVAGVDLVEVLGDARVAAALEAAR